MVKIVKNPGNGRLNNLNDPNRPQCVKLQNKVYFTPVAFISVPIAKMWLLGDNMKYPQHRRKQGLEKLRNNKFATELVAYCPSSLVAAQKKSTKLTRSK